MLNSKKISRRKKLNGRKKNNLRPLVLVLGIFAVVSVSIILFALLQKLGPEVYAAPGIYKVLNYQGKLEDADGVTVADGAYNIKFTIYDAAAAGNVLWTARESDACGAAFSPSAKSVTATLGVFSTQLGESGDCPLNLDFNSDSYYLGITVGADSEMTPRKRIGAAGYAFNADLLDGLTTSLVGGATSFVPATDASGNLVLTANITFDTPTFFLDSTNDNIGIGTITPDTDRMLDLVISKKYGLYASSSSATNHTAVIYAEATDTTNVDQMGGYFSAASPDGKGVYGAAVTPGNAFIANYGGYFTSAGDTGIGVHGETTASGLGTVGIGGEFTSAGDGGYGIWATATGTAGVNYGGNFVANGPGGYGVKTWANDISAAANYGGYFRASGQVGYGVYGWAGGTAAANYGGYFKADGAGGYGVYGTATDTTAVVNYGGYFLAAGQGGYGLYGYASEITVANYGVTGLADGPAGYGVYGYAANVAGGNYGGYFEGGAAASYGAYGKASGLAGYGVYGTATASGATTNYGGYFTAAGDTGVGVFGASTAVAGASGIGGRFEVAGTGGASAVSAVSTGATGNNYGIYTNVLSATGWSGYFQGGRGIYAERLAINDAVSAVAYNTVGTAAATHTAAGEIENSSDLFIADDLEIGGTGWSTGGYTDLAEMVAYSGEGEAGDVIVIDKNYDNTAKIATEPYDQSVLGVISEKPSLIITGGIKEGKLLAVAGRIPTKVTNINGAIHRGDPLTTSSMPGYAMKATAPGPIVGKALGECNESECNIWVFLNVSWYGGN
jgi:hypothetical protein